jgi:hypothetical protein
VTPTTKIVTGGRCWHILFHMSEALCAPLHFIFCSNGRP